MDLELRMFGFSSLGAYGVLIVGTSIEVLLTLKPCMTLRTLHFEGRVLY